MARCLVFQQNKGVAIKELGPIQPPSIPSQCWEEVSLGLIIGLTKYEGKNVSMVVMDKLTK